MSSRQRTCAAVGVIFAVLLASSAATGQSPEDKTAAQVAFDKGLALLEAGKPDEACPLFEDSLRLDAAMGTQYQLAQCYEQTGRIASAWASYTAVADAAQAQGMADREKWARERADALAPRLSKLTIVVPEAVAALRGLTVERDGRSVPRTLWGVAIPVDGGSHRVVATAPGRASFEGSVSVGAERAVARLELAMLEPAGEHDGSGAPGPATAPAHDQPTDGTAAGDEGSAQTIAGLVIAGVGVAAMVAGVAVGLAAKSGYDESGEEHCAEGFCDPEGVDAADDARVLGNVATGLFIGGGAALVAGVITWLTAPSGPDVSARDAASGRWRIEVAAGPGDAGVGLRARW